jgi:hypothetical protein
VTQKTLIGTLPLELDAMLDCCLPVVDTGTKRRKLATRRVRPMRSLIIGGFCSDMPDESSHDKGTVSDIPFY